MTKNATAGRAGKVKANEKKPAAAAAKKTKAKTKASGGTTTPTPVRAVHTEVAKSRGDVRTAVPIPVAAIRADKGQPRRRFNLEDILYTLEQKDGEPLPGKGITEPITVRRAPDDATEYEIIKGERRWRSACKVGFTTIHAFIADGKLDAAEILALQLRENIARRDLEPLEIADGITDMIANSGRRKLAVADIAARIGSTPAQVYRYRALAELVTPVRVALTEHLISQSVALELATVSKKQQPAALELVRKVELRQARTIIRDRFHLPLSGEAFDPIDPELPGGPCEVCPKNTKTQRTLFELVSDDAPRCTDHLCYEVKQATTWERRKASAIEAGAAVLEGDEAAKLFPARSSSTPEGEHIDLDQPCMLVPPPESGKPIPTWREVLGPSITPSIVAVDKSGQAHEIITYD